MKNAEINFINDPDNQDKLHIIFSGELTISNTPDFKELIMQRVNSTKALTITTREVESIDLSFYQLLLSIKKTLQEQEKTVNLNLSLPAEEKELMMQAGFETNL